MLFYILAGIIGFGLVFNDVLTARKSDDFKIYKLEIGLPCVIYILIALFAALIFWLISLISTGTALILLTFMATAACAFAGGVFVAGLLFVRERPPF